MLCLSPNSQKEAGKGPSRERERQQTKGQGIEQGKRCLCVTLGSTQKQCSRNNKATGISGAKANSYEQEPPKP